MTKKHRDAHANRNEKFGMYTPMVGRAGCRDFVRACQCWLARPRDGIGSDARARITTVQDKVQQLIYLRQSGGCIALEYGVDIFVSLQK